MENQESVYLGVVMGWEPTPTPDCINPFNSSQLVVTEFCPGGLQSGKIQPTGRMVELAVAGFMPVGIVYGDPREAGCYSLLAHRGASEAVRQHLVREAEAIIRDAADSVACRDSAR